MRVGVFGVLLVALVASMLFAIGAGRFSVSVPRIIDILVAGALNPGLAPTQMDERIVLLVRLPRVLLAALSGAALAVGGAALVMVEMTSPTMRSASGCGSNMLTSMPESRKRAAHAPPITPPPIQAALLILVIF